MSLVNRIYSNVIGPQRIMTDEDWDIICNRLGRVARAATVAECDDWPEDAWIMLDRTIETQIGG